MVQWFLQQRVHTTQSLFVDDLCLENCPWIVIGPCSAVLLINVAIEIEMGLIAKEDLVKIWYLLVFACVSNRKMFSTSNCVSWILYACNDKSFVNILCKVIVDKSNCCALWRLDLFGFLTTSPLMAAMFLTERLLWAHTVLFTFATDLVSLNFFKIFPKALYVGWLCGSKNNNEQK